MRVVCRFTSKWDTRSKKTNKNHLRIHYLAVIEWIFKWIISSAKWRGYFFNCSWWSPYFIRLQLQLQEHFHIQARYFVIFVLIESLLCWDLFVFYLLAIVLWMYRSSWKMLWPSENLWRWNLLSKRLMHEDWVPFGLLHGFLHVNIFTNFSEKQFFSHFSLHLFYKIILPNYLLN